MRWHLLAVALAAGCLLAGCSQTQLAPNARIIGTNGMAQVGDFLFVTSTDRAELRVLDLKASTRDFVRAPNPLEPLSIPVLDRPVNLVRDLRYDDAGQEVAGPYLYAQAEAAQEISIVGTDRTTQLVELARLPTQGVVTALAAQGPSRDGEPSTLYFATLNGAAGQLWQIAIPSPGPSGKISGSLDPMRATGITYGPGGSRTGDPISALLIMPNKRLVVASRSAVSKVGRTIVLDPAAPEQQTELVFATTCGPNGNRPCSVRLLATHPAIGDTPETLLNAGSRVFGVIDEDGCVGTTCGSVLAVDASPGSPRLGQIALDKTGNPMVPLTFGSTLPTGLTLAPSAPLFIPVNDPTTPTLLLMGVVSTSSGLVYFFDAGALRFIDISGDVAKATAIVYADASGTQISTYVPGPRFESIQVAHGATIDETIWVTYQGTIPGLRGLSTNGGSNQLAVDRSLVTRVLRGDAVTLASCTPAETRVLDIIIPATGPNATLILPDTDVIQCSGTGTFSVRAAGAQPYVVEGVFARADRPPSGYMGRTSNGTADQDQAFAFPADEAARKDRYYFHPTNYDPKVPQIQFNMGPGDPNIQRDWFYAINTVSNFAPEFLLVDTAIGVEFHLPSTSVYVGTVSGGVDVSRLFVAYPSANAILEINPISFLPNRANARFITAYR